MRLRHGLRRQFDQCERQLLGEPCFPLLQTATGSALVWVFACMCGAGFALASAYSWRIKTNWFTKV
jgi:hypothetical protein